MSPAAERVMARADALAAISETPDALTRVYLSTQHLQANQLVGQWMSQAGMTVWQDSVGNICGRYEGAQEGAQAVLVKIRRGAAEKPNDRQSALGTASTRPRCHRAAD